MTTYTFNVRRSGDTAVPCSVAWALEGTGANPITGASFAGGVLPAGTADFSPGELAQAVSFELTATARPLVTQTGRLILRNPVTCKIDPNGERHTLTIPAGVVTSTEWDFVAANMAVQPGPGQASRVTFSAPGGVPQVAVAGAPNEDGRDIALWFKTLPFQNYEVIWEYEKNEDLPAVDAGGRFAQVWGSIVGTLKPADVTTWTSAQWGDAGDGDYGDYSQCWRISHDTESTSADNANEARLIEFTQGDRNAPVPVPGPNFPMSGTGTKWRLVLRRDGQVVTLSKTPGGEAIQWSTPEVARMGRIGFRFARGRGGILRHHPDGSPFMRSLAEGPPPPPQTGTFPGDWRVWQRATSGPNRILVNNAAALRTAINNAQSGHQILLPAGGSIDLGGDLIIDRPVSGNDAYYIATDTDSDDPAALCQLTGGGIVIDTQCRRAVVNGFRCNGPSAKTVIRGGRLFQLERIQYSGMPGDVAGGSSYSVAAIIRIEGSPQDCLLGFLHSQNNGASFWDIEQNHAPVGMLMTHWWEDRATLPSKLMQPGRNPGDGGHDTISIAQYFLSSGRANYPDDLVEYKYNGLWFRFNTIEMASHPNQQTKIRQGRMGVAGQPGPAQGDVFEGNLYVLPPTGGGQPWLSTRGAHHHWINNWAVRLGSGESPSLASPLASGRLTCFVGASNGETFPETDSEPSGCNRRAGAHAAHIGGNRGFTVSAEWDSCARNNPSPGGPFRPRNCRIAPASADRPDRNTAVNLTDFLNTDSNTRVAGADYTKVPVRTFSSQVGPRGWRSQFAQVYGR